MDVVDLQKDSITFKEHINIIHFLGKHPDSKETQVYNLNEVVFKKLDKYTKFQLISFYVGANNPEIETIKKRLEQTGDDKLYKWKFICLDSVQTVAIYNSLKTKTALDTNLSADDSFIIDKKLQQRGRTDDDKIGEEVFAYNMLSVNDLKNKLFTDTKNVFYEQEVSTTSRQERLGKDEK